MILIVAALAAFQFTIFEDPVTLERESTMVANDDGNTITLHCDPKRHNLDIVFLPRRYSLPGVLVASLATPESRFEGAPTTERNWSYSTEGIKYDPTNVWKLNRTIATFLDQLPQHSALHIHFTSALLDADTVSVHYTVDVERYKRFLGRCASPELTSALRKMNSAIAPDQATTTAP